MIKKILVSQPQPSSTKSPYYEIASKHNVELVFRPFFQIESITPKEFRAQKINILDYTAIVFTSRTAVDHFFTLCKALRVDLPDDMKYFGISEAVSLYIQKYVQYRKRKVFFGTSGKWPELLVIMTKHKTERYLVPLSSVHDDKIQNMLDSKKLIHKECVMFRTISNDFKPEENFDYDMLIFFTPTGIQSLLKNFPDFKQGDIRMGCFGPSTAKSIIDAGFRLDMQAPNEKAPSITSALDLYLTENE